MGRVGVVAGAVGIVEPEGMERPLVEIQAGVIAQIDGVVGIIGIAGAVADLLIWRNDQAITLRRHNCGEKLRIVVGAVVGIPRPTDAIVIAAVIPGNGHLAGGLIERNAREELRANAGVIVNADRIAPDRTAVVAVAQENVGVVAAVGEFVSIDFVDAPREWPAAVVERQSRL